MRKYHLQTWNFETLNVRNFKMNSFVIHPQLFPAEFKTLPDFYGLHKARA